MDDPEDLDTITFNDFLDSLDLINLVHFGTYISNHTLDLVIQSNSFKVNSKSLKVHFLLDHAFIHHTLKAEWDPPPTHIVNYHKIKNINKMDFKSDLANISMGEKLDLHHLVEVYNQNLAEILGIHAPLKSKTLKITHIQPWFNDKIKMEILLRRQLEQRWLQDPTQYNLQSFYYQRRHVANIIKTAQNTTTRRRLQRIVMIPKLFSGYSILFSG